MRDEHFGISVVEFMAAGALVAALIGCMQRSCEPERE